MRPGNQDHQSWLSLFWKAGKLVIYLSLLFFVFPMTWMGFTFHVGPLEFTPFGFALLVRMLLQLPLAWANNWYYSTAVRQVIIAGLQELYPGQRIWSKPWVRYDLWVTQLERRFPGLEDRWPKVLFQIQQRIKLPALKGRLDLPKLGGVIPVYGVSQEEAYAMLNALAAQVYHFARVDVVINDPGNEELQAQIADWIDQQFDSWRWHLIMLPIANKRAAQATGFNNHYQSGITASINVDSDVVAHPHAAMVTAITYALFPEVEGITANVRVSNTSNPPSGDRKQDLWAWLLAWWTYYRYSYANNVERAAESFFGGVICMSGPWMAAVTDTIMIFLPQWLTQTFFKKEFRPGDDRRLTWWFNRLHRVVVYQPDIIVWTDAPVEMFRYIRQQFRWAQSAQANFVDGVLQGQILELPLWSGFDTLYLGLFMYNLLIELSRITFVFFRLLGSTGLDAAWAAIDQYVWLFVGIALFRGLYAAITTRNWRGLVVGLYAILFIRVQVPCRLAAMVSPVQTGWPGRKGQ